MVKIHWDIYNVVVSLMCHSSIVYTEMHVVGEIMYVSIHSLLPHAVGEIKFGKIFVTICSMSHWRNF